MDGGGGERAHPDLLRVRPVGHVRLERAPPHADDGRGGGGGGVAAAAPSSSPLLQVDQGGRRHARPASVQQEGRHLPHRALAGQDAGPGGGRGEARVVVGAGAPPPASSTSGRRGGGGGGDSRGVPPPPPPARRGFSAASGSSSAGLNTATRAPAASRKK